MENHHFQRLNHLHVWWMLHCHIWLPKSTPRIGMVMWLANLVVPESRIWQNAPPFLLQVNFYDSVRQLRSSPFPSFFISKLSRRSTIVQSWVAHSMIHWLIVLVAGIRSSGCFPWCVVQWNEDSPPGKEGTGWGWLQSMDVVFENQLKSHIVVLQWTGHWLVWKQELTLSSIKRQLLHWGQSWWTITRWALDGQVITIVHKYITHCISKTLYLSI
jgi:hypothetical protein